MRLNGSNCYVIHITKQTTETLNSAGKLTDNEFIYLYCGNEKGEPNIEYLLGNMMKLRLQIFIYRF